MNSGLASFQDKFARALTVPQSIDPASGGLAFGLARQPGFAVYRNTVMKGWIDALEGNFPAVVAVVGRDWFRAAAAEYATLDPASTSLLDCYGIGFPGFLATFEPSRAMPYLADVAWLDWMAAEAIAAAMPPPRGRDIASLLPEELTVARMRLQPSARLYWCETSAPSIWLDARGIAQESELVFEERGEGLVLVGREAGFSAALINRAQKNFIRTITGGGRVGDAATAFMADNDETGLIETMRMLLDLGAIELAESRGADQ